MYGDSDILNDVVAELKTEPSLRDNDIAVGVRDGVVSPAGFVDSYAEALQRAAQFDAERITVEIVGHKAILWGTVRSYAELKDVERAVRNVSGITEVENHLTVDPSIYTPV